MDKIRINYEGAWDMVSVYYYTDTHIAKPVVLEYEECERDGYIVEPTMRMPIEWAQQMINELWREGFRPNNGEGSVSQVESMKEHIKDLRAIAYKQLGIE